MRRSVPSLRCRTVDLLAQGVVRPAQQRSHVSNLDTKRAGDLRVTQAAVPKHQQRCRALRKPPERAPDLAPSFRFLDRPLRVRRGCLGWVERVCRLSLRAPPLATNHVECRMNRGRMQPTRRSLGVGGDATMELEYYIMRDFLR